MEREMTPDYRDRLVNLLDKLSSASDVERAKAAGLVEEYRAASGLTWGEIIPLAPEGKAHEPRGAAYWAARFSELGTSKM
jgi:hypothetical protein